MSTGARCLAILCSAFALLMACGPGGGGGPFFYPSDGGAAKDGALVESCEDKRIDGKETDIDCGGPDCAACGSGRACLHSTDCVSGGCFNNRCVEVGGRCADGLKNGDETDVDCGGPTCSRCGLGKTCTVGGDCVSLRCVDGLCAQPAPADGGIDAGRDGGIDGGFDGGPNPDLKPITDGGGGVPDGANPDLRPTDGFPVVDLGAKG